MSNRFVPRTTGETPPVQPLEPHERQILDSARSFAVVVTDLEGRITGWNEGAHRVLGWTEEEVLGRSASVFFTPEDVAQGRPQAEMRCALEQGFSPDERWHQRKGGERFWASGEMTPLKDASGQAVGFVKILTDRTAQVRACGEGARLPAPPERRAEDPTPEEERLWRNALDLLLVIAPDGTFGHVNPAWTATLGYSEDELVGQRVEDYVHPDDVDRTLAAMREALQRPVQDVEIRARARDGGYRWTVWAAASENGVIYASGRDVTQEKLQAQQVARTHESRLQLALAVGELGAWEWEVQADHVRWLEGAAALHGFAPGKTPPRFTMEDYLRLVHPEDRARLEASLGRALASGGTERVEYRVVWPDGSVHWMEARGEVVLQDSGRPLLMSGVTVDMTRRKRTERDLEFVATASAELAQLVDPASTLEKLAFLAVPFFADWCAVDMLQDDGTLHRVAVAHIDPQKVELARDVQRRFPPDPATSHGVWHVLRTGQPSWVPMVTDQLLEQSVPNPEYRAILRELGLRSYIGVPVTAHGRAIGVVAFVTAESGRLYDERDLAIAEDVARRVSTAIENAGLYQALQESDRGKDVFIATLAHELRNPLAAIASALKVVELAGPDRGRVEAATRIAGRQVAQLAHLVDDLMDISRITTGKIELRPAPTDLSALLRGVVETARAEIELARHELSLRLPEEPVELVADPTRLTQVFANLLGNAVKYTPPGGRIELSLGCEPAQCVVRVRDSGVGIPGDRLRDVFRMFTQLDHPLERSQGGLGIGLALVEGLVRLHGGEVEARSPGLGRGSEFIVRLPRAGGEAPQAAPPAGDDAAAQPPAAQAAPGRARRILVVDDNVDAAQALAELLGLLGHRVIGLVHDGPAAVPAALELRPDLVLLDIGLPGMNGYEVAREIRARAGEAAPELIALTGWGTERDREQAIAAGFDRHWVKPVGIEQLETLAQQSGT